MRDHERPVGDRDAGATLDEAEVDRVVHEYTQASQRLDTLARQAAALGQRLERLGRGLSGHASRRLVAGEGQSADDAAEWDALLAQPLPGADVLTKLTSDIRDAALKVHESRERLVLMGRPDLIGEPDWFFH